MSYRVYQVHIIRVAAYMYKVFEELMQQTVFTATHLHHLEIEYPVSVRFVAFHINQHAVKQLIILVVWPSRLAAFVGGELLNAARRTINNAAHAGPSLEIRPYCEHLPTSAPIHGQTLERCSRRRARNVNESHVPLGDLGDRSNNPRPRCPEHEPHPRGRRRA